MIASFPRITSRTTADTAIRLLREHALPALPVYRGGSCVGLVDEKSLLRLTPSDATSLSVYEVRTLLDRVTVQSVVFHPAATVTPDTPVSDAAKLMTHTAAEVVPVEQHGCLVGLLPWTHVLAALIGESPPAGELAGAARKAPWF
jgi:acetoin utilization protein AcuB